MKNWNYEMTKKDLLSILRNRYEIKYNPYNIILNFNLENDQIVFDCNMLVPDVDTGRAGITGIAGNKVIKVYKDIKETFRVCDWEVYASIKSAIFHEIEETFTVNGERLFDPHMMATYEEPLTEAHKAAQKRIELYLMKEESR
jgi:hypothetical protein